MAGNRVNVTATVYYTLRSGKILSCKNNYGTLFNCSKCAARRYISSIPVYYLQRLCVLNDYRFNESKWLNADKGKNETEDPRLELLQTRTTPRT